VLSFQGREPILDSGVHQRFPLLRLVALFLVAVYGRLNGLDSSHFLLINDLLETHKLDSESVEHVRNSFLVRPYPLSSHLVNDLPFVLRNHVVLDLDDHLRGSFDDLVFELQEFSTRLR